MKKFFAMFLSLVMILSLSVPAFAAETDTVTSTEENKNTATQNVTASYTPSSTEPTLPSTIYFDNSAAGWTAVNACFSDGSSQQVGTPWPGTAMTKVEGEENIYSIEVPAGAISVIFNDGANQTANLTIPTDGKNMYDYDNSEWTTYTPSSTEVSLVVMLKAVDSTGAAITSGVCAIMANSIIHNLWGTTTYNLITTGDYTMTYDTIPTGYKTPADVSLTVTDTNGDGVGELTSNSSHATVELVDGVYYITVTLEKETTEPATITGVSITVDGTEYTSGSVTITPDSTVTLTVTGTNLQNGTQDNYVHYAYGVGAPVTSGYFNFSEDGTTATYKGSVPASNFANSSNFEIKYSNDGQQSWTNTGIYVTYDAGVSEDEKAEITGVSITVDGTEYTSGSVTITPDSTVTLTVTGTNLQNGTQDNYVHYAYGVGAPVTSGYFNFSEDGTTATYKGSVPASHFANSSNFEIKYSNDGKQSWTNTGIYVIYQSETVSVDITWGAMSFTYDDTVAEGENGWTCAEGANKITVANNSTVAVVAALAYAPANGYDWLGGYFELADGVSVPAHTIAASGSEDFYLILDSDKPEAAFSGTVGTVTVTITESEIPEGPILPEG